MMSDKKTCYQKPLSVICIKSNNTKLIIGAKYLATTMYYVYNSNVKKVAIKNVGNYTADSFTLETGEPLIDLDVFFVNSAKDLDIENNNYVGKLVRCRYSDSKILKNGQIYYVEEQFIDRTKKYLSYYIKIKGVKHKIQSYNFEELPVSEQRAIKIKNIAGDKLKTTETTRKFLLYTEIEKTEILLKSLLLILSDINKIENLDKLNIDIIQLIKNKCKKYNVIEDDIYIFLKNDIKSIIDLYGIKI